MTGGLKPQLYIPAREDAVIRRAAAQAYPRECCGLLLGEGEAGGERRLTVTGVIPAENVADDPHRAFAIDPQLQFDLLRVTRGQKQRIIGHYHSHPDGQATPSVHDLAMAHDPEAIWVVVAAFPHEVSAPRAYHRPDSADAFREIPVTTLS